MDPGSRSGECAILNTLSHSKQSQKLRARVPRRACPAVACVAHLNANRYNTSCLGSGVRDYYTRVQHDLSTIKSWLPCFCERFPHARTEPGNIDRNVTYRAACFYSHDGFRIPLRVHTPSIRHVGTSPPWRPCPIALSLKKVNA